MSARRLDPFEALDKYAWHRCECPAALEWASGTDSAYESDHTKPRGRCTCGLRKILDYYRTNA